MKKWKLLLVLMPFSVFGQIVHEQIIKSDIKKVKLFLTAGEMQHEQLLKLAKGRNKIVFSGISTYADPQSIQFYGDGNFRLVSVSTEMDFLAAEQFNPRISILQDSLDILTELIQMNDDIKSSYQSELLVLNTNKDLKGDNQNITVAQIKEVADFFRNRTFEINQKLTKIKKEQDKYKSKIDNILNQLVELNYDENLRSNQVIVLIDADVESTINSSLKYLVSDCGWAATYDLAANDLNQKINLKYKAKVYNNTGNDWKNLDLVLSTGDPRLSATHPELIPWHLSGYGDAEMDNRKSYYTPQVVQQDFQKNANDNLDIANQRVYDNYIRLEESENEQTFNIGKSKSTAVEKKEVAKNSVQMRQIEISQLTTEFIVPNKFSCPTDAKPYTVEIKEMNLDATFSHITVPKLDNSSFLMAHIVGWQDLELIPGPTNVYFGGAYVGVSEIDTRNVDDTLSLSFGRDSKVVVYRKLKKEMSIKRVTGNSKKDSYVYEISVRNNRTVPVKINIFDQIPISTNNEIIVTVDNISKATKDELTGETVWEYVIQPGQVQLVEIAYTVKYPKNMKINLQTFKVISCPSF